MRMYDIIRKKRDGCELSAEEIRFFIDGYVQDRIPDYQAAALCMAIYYRGMTDAETVAMTECMAQSGDTVDLSRFGALSVDKHSTGGVGDKTSLIICPIVASLGCKVAKMSGRGLGHTGGTVDKLESIPGYRVTMSQEAFMHQVEEIGIAVIGQSGNLTPADKKLYALRDVTATVDSIPLITSSIMSKKLAAGSRNIVLDVKVGSGAFMKTPQTATELARTMVNIGKQCGRNVSALITDMNRPLGRAIGNTLEVIEAVEVLTGKRRGDLYEVSVALATEMVTLVKGINDPEARSLVIDAIDSGAAFDKLKEWIAAQGGDIRYLQDTSRFETPSCITPVISPADGYITAMDTERIGSAAVLLGAGRSRKDEPIDYAAGIIVEQKTGDRVSAGEVLATLYSNDERAISPATERYLGAISFGDEPPESGKLILGVVG